MNNMIVIKFLLQGVPETAAVLFTALAIVGCRVRMRAIVGYTFFITSVIYLIRLAPIPFGIHSIIAIIVFVIVLYKLSGVSFGTAVFAATTVMFFLTIVEFAFYYLINDIFNYDIDYTFNNGEWLWVIAGWPQIFVMWLVGYLMQNYWSLPYFKANRYKGERNGK